MKIENSVIYVANNFFNKDITTGLTLVKIKQLKLMADLLGLKSKIHTSSILDGMTGESVGASNNISLVVESNDTGKSIYTMADHVLACGSYGTEEYDSCKITKYLAGNLKGKDISNKQVYHISGGGHGEMYNITKLLDVGTAVADGSKKAETQVEKEPSLLDASITMPSDCVDTDKIEIETTSLAGQHGIIRNLTCCRRLDLYLRDCKLPPMGAKLIENCPNIRVIDIDIYSAEEAEFTSKVEQWAKHTDLENVHEIYINGRTRILLG